MTVVKWDPYRDVWTLQDRVNRLFQEGMSAPQGQEDLQAGQWTPPVDIFENAETIVLRADLPGVDQDDIEMRVEGGTLVIRGRRRLSGDLRPEDMHRAERPHGTFVRSFGLPTNVDQAGIRATQKNGVLEVILPKRQESKAKAIRIEVK
ncbi:MAG TPA: Hsp20/alpha crystallin family protein [Candidatus Dormibacteraeota bacterium]|nr:Hsp20/alpha crystallin family protein [Candidatus Dormibacteraeota bacterium]